MPTPSAGMFISGVGEAACMKVRDSLTTYTGLRRHSAFHGVRISVSMEVIISYIIPVIPGRQSISIAR